MLDRILSMVQAGLILFKLAGIGQVQYWSWLKILSPVLYLFLAPVIYTLMLSAYVTIKAIYKKQTSKEL